MILIYMHEFDIAFKLATVHTTGSSQISRQELGKGLSSCPLRDTRAELSISFVPSAGGSAILG